MWITLTVDQIQNSLSNAEQSAMSSTSSAADLQDIIQGVTALVRGKVQTWAANQSVMGPLGTIPDETLAAATAIARYKFLTSLPGTSLITKWREQENDRAYDLLDEVADGKMVIVGATGIIALLPAAACGEPYFPPYMRPPPISPVWGDGYW